MHCCPRGGLVACCTVGMPSREPPSRWLRSAFTSMHSRGHNLVQARSDSARGLRTSFLPLLLVGSSPFGPVCTALLQVSTSPLQVRSTALKVGSFALLVSEAPLAPNV